MRQVNPAPHLNYVMPSYLALGINDPHDSAAQVGMLQGANGVKLVSNRIRNLIASLFVGMHNIIVFRHKNSIHTSGDLSN